MNSIRYDIPPPHEPVACGRKNNNPFSDMKVGGSFLVEDDRLAAVRVSACRENKKGLKKFQVARHKTKVGVEWRCWRVE